MSDNLFFEEIDSIAKILKRLLKEKKAKVVSHYDADGLCSASILSKALDRENCGFELRIIKQLTESEIRSIDLKENEVLILADLGSGQIDGLWNILEKNQILILDHHDPVRKEHMNLFHLNPLLFGEEEISGSMVCYLFAKSMNIKNTDMVDLAIVGAIGDIMDENWKLKGIAGKIVEEAEMLGKLTVERGLKLYGRSTRPLFKALEYSTELNVPNVTGSESGSAQFLSDIGIEVHDGERFKRFDDLTVEEQRKLASAIIVEKMNHNNENPDDIFGDIYTILGRPEELQNVREFATLLNACGRTGNYHIGVRLCLGDLNAMKCAWEVMEKYRRMIGSGMSWVKEGNLDIRDNLVILDAGSNIPDTIIGTVSSMVLGNKSFGSDKIILAFSESDEGKLKVSSRMPNHLNFNLRDILFEASKTVGGESGGHPFAAGALIDADKKDEFIKAIETKISKLATK